MEKNRISFKFFKISLGKEGTPLFLSPRFEKGEVKGEP
jgi:hypothetical protein